MQAWATSRRRFLIIIGLAALAAAGVLGYLASPLFIRTRLVEDLPFEVRASSPRQQPPATGAEAQRPPVGPQTQAVAGGSQPAQLLRTGTFSDRDRIHQGSGEALLARTQDGTHVLRFESFRVTNGPDLHVLLSRFDRPTTHDEVYSGVYVGKLKASEGAFHYELPRDADLSSIRSVIVYCVPFRVIFTSAPLSPS